MANSPPDHEPFWEAVLRNTQSLARGDEDGSTADIQASLRALGAVGAAVKSSCGIDTLF